MTMTTESPPAGGTYLIALGDYLVAQDIAETIADFAPQANVVMQTTLAGAVAALQDVGKIELAFVGAGPDSFSASPLSKLITERDGRVVLMGDEAEATGAAAGWAVLQRPFSMQQVRIHLAGRESR